MDVAKVDKAPGKGLLITISLSYLHGVAAPPCHQHRSWEPVRRLAGSAGVTPSSLLIRRTPVPAGCGLDRRGLH